MNLGELEIYDISKSKWHDIAALQKMAAVETASAEERERLRAVYKQRMHDMDARLKVLLHTDTIETLSY